MSSCDNLLIEQYKTQNKRVAIQNLLQAENVAILKLLRYRNYCNTETVAIWILLRTENFVIQKLLGYTNGKRLTSQRVNSYSRFIDRSKALVYVMIDGYKHTTFPFYTLQLSITYFTN